MLAIAVEIVIVMVVVVVAATVVVVDEAAEIEIVQSTKRKIIFTPSLLPLITTIMITIMVVYRLGEDHEKESALMTWQWQLS